MATRDPDRTARNRIIANIKGELRRLLPSVLDTSGAEDEASLNAKIGSKTGIFIDLKNDVINSHDEFTNKWLTALKKARSHGPSDSIDWIWNNLLQSPDFKAYVLLFLKRSYLKYFDELSKRRPRVEDSEIWIGQQRANYGLLVTPRFANGQWENDKSEIRAFASGYWTVGHVLTTGLCHSWKEQCDYI
jgi:hypothetical protein